MGNMFEDMEDSDSEMEVDDESSQPKSKAASKKDAKKSKGMEHQSQVQDDSS